jgi:hypothetical protein
VEATVSQNCETPRPGFEKFERTMQILLSDFDFRNIFKKEFGHDSRILQNDRVQTSKVSPAAVDCHAQAHGYTYLLREKPVTIVT